MITFTTTKSNTGCRYKLVASIGIMAFSCLTGFIYTGDRVRRAMVIVAEILAVMLAVIVNVRDA